MFSWWGCLDFAMHLRQEDIKNVLWKKNRHIENKLVVTNGEREGTRGKGGVGV